MHVGAERHTARQADGMDYVLVLHRMLDHLMTLDAANEVLGFPGLAQALVDMGLVQSLGPGDEQAPCICSSSLARMLDRVYSQAVLSPSPDGTIELSVAVRQLALDPFQLAFHFAQLVGDGLAIAGWNAGRNLAGLSLRMQDLEGLAWPARPLSTQ